MTAPQPWEDWKALYEDERERALLWRGRALNALPVIKAARLVYDASCEEAGYTALLNDLDDALLAYDKGWHGD